LAAGGQAGVEEVHEIIRSGIDSALLGLGHSWCWISALTQRRA
jgi:isopentenyl diphosphate isomerase/L-lactate dehydrogenase-like FMN-dependent dehydrogenase